MTGDLWLWLECAGRRPYVHFLLCPAFHRLSFAFLNLPKVPFYPSWFPHHVCFFLIARNSPQPSAFHQNCWTFVLFLFSSSFHPNQLWGDFSYLFRYPKSLTNVQQVFCENCSICRCILDATSPYSAILTPPLVHFLIGVFVFLLLSCKSWVLVAINSVPFFSPYLISSGWAP